MSQDNSFYMVAIGMSAGGFPALEKLIASLPDPVHACFVIIVHLPKDSKSRMASLLSTITYLPVSWAKQAEKPETSHIYVLPPGYLLTMQEGNFHLQPRAADQNINRAVDIFFTSLAKEVKQRAIGIILSGSGSDGLEGVQAIEANGGLVLVQHPATAQFESMPANVVNNDHPDFITSPEGIAHALRCHLQIPPFQSASEN
ncbi:chemotaxis protein CheB [Rhodocytophaga rosea]|uniref:protein-glutamate methylesterase n=1 Tax=Rhodocytophaga rosea TaxID=2704465 RepID=A0A6C0GMG4_9BACT|nr:chemotaxis protein CheB [Rhodocytophaga rosea]QHT69127.1 chemotaxis protein CheB [Rhodocytophaga rosea]